MTFLKFSICLVILEIVFLSYVFTYQIGIAKGMVNSDNDWPRIYFNGPIQLAPGTTLSGLPGHSIFHLLAKNYIAVEGK